MEVSRSFSNELSIDNFEVAMMEVNRSLSNGMSSDSLVMA